MKAAQRKKLPSSAFALPSKRLYLINTVGRARAALSRSAQKNTASSYPVIARAVRRRWGNKIASVGTARGTTARPGYRRKST